MTISDCLQSGALFALFIGILFSYFQLRKISSSMLISQQANIVNAISHCCDRYERIFSDLPKHIKKKEIEVWWYRYWDLYTAEFNFFCKSLIDPMTFELWINELATVYQRPPINRQRLLSRVERHKKYLDSTLPYYKELHEFFSKLNDISKITDSKQRAKRVHNLIEEYAPSRGPFEKIYRKFKY